MCTNRITKSSTMISMGKSPIYLEDSELDTMLLIRSESILKKPNKIESTGFSIITEY